jgi:hypothetical protein
MHRKLSLGSIEGNYSGMFIPDSTCVTSLSYNLTDFMEPSPFPEADSCITEPEDGTLLLSVHKGPPIGTLQSHFNPFHIFTLF